MPETPNFDQISDTMQTLTRAVERCNVAVQGLSEVCDRMRREHPEWFDLETGYLRKHG